MENPLVSIIIPTYNRAHLIRETLDSVLAQTYKNWECIVVDDGSSDNTAEVLELYKKKDIRFQYHLRPTNYAKGGNGARNYGFNISKGEFINWFDDDDVMHISKLSIQVESLLKSNYMFSICQTLNFKYDFNDFYGLRPEDECLEDPFEAYLKEEFVVFTPSTLWNKKFLIERNYKFNESLKASQEWEFYCNVFFKDKFFSFVKKPLVYIRYHDQRITTKTPSQKFWHYYLARFIVYKKYYKKLPFNIKKYFINYFISIYKMLLKRKEYLKALKIFFVIFFAKTLNFKMKFFLILSLFSFTIFKRGEFFISRIKS